MICQILFSKKNKKNCMKCQILFSEKNKKNISKCHLLKFLPSMQSVIELFNKERSSAVLSKSVSE